ncbi:MAG: hypothetical protein A2Y79_09115 [Deltaproteobacteria bacterium RBG_13_43_22]|nr:MAG: hypothetical protein A2Y79_09115 [Deltaproteobacteria bacterium RBG_13_43_22]
MKKKLTFLLWIPGFFLWLGLASPAGLPPCIQLIETDYDFGTVDEGSILSHDYSVKNTGPGILEITDIRPG